MNIFKKGAFSYDPNMTPQQLADKWAMLALLQPKYGKASYIGEGLGQLATGVATGIRTRKLDEIEGKGREQGANLFSGLFGGTTQSTSGQSGPMNILGVDPGYGDPNDPVNIAGDTMTALGKDQGTAGYRASLIGTESGGNWGANNDEMGAGGKRGHYGRVQFGQARLQEAMDAGAIPQGTTPEQFMASPALQIAAENWHFGDLEKQLAPYVGAVVNGQTMDLGALVAMGHLGGAAGAKRFVESGGKYNPSDAYGTSLLDYARTHGGQLGGPVAAPAGASTATNSAMPSIDPQALAAALANPWLSPEERSVLTTIYDQQVQAGDPLRQIEVAKGMAELEAGYNMLTPEEVAQLGLPRGAYQRGGDGKIVPIGKDGVTVNVGGDGAPGLGKLSADYGYVLDPITRQPVIDPETGLPKAAPVPGSPAAREIAATTATAEKGEQNAATATEVVTSAAARAREAHSKRAVGGIFGQWATMNPSSENAELYRQVDVLKSNAKVENLNAMRQASPTGGALGSVTEKEADMLAAKSGALDPASPYFERDLADYELTLLRTVHGFNEGNRIFAELYPEGVGGVTGGAPAPAAGGGLQPGAIEDGFRFRGGDPSDPANWEQVQ